jgi:hypothetical protein
MRAKIGSLESHLPSGFISEIKTASIRKYIAAKIIATGFNALATRLFRVGGCKLGTATTTFDFVAVGVFYCSSGNARWSPALSISAPILFETMGACPDVSFRGMPATSVATSGTVALGDLSGVVLCNTGGMLSHEGRF